MMPRSLFGVVAMSLVLALGVSAQDHQHGAQSDSSQSGMMQMHQQMQAMHEQMMQMLGQEGGMQGMEGMQGMQGMGQQQAMQGTCFASDPEVGLSTFLLGSASDLGLTEAQRAQLQSVLDRARNEALEALTSEQRQKLEDAPAARPMCQQTGGSAAGGN